MKTTKEKSDEMLEMRKNEKVQIIQYPTISNYTDPTFLLKNKKLSNEWIKTELIDVRGIDYLTIFIKKNKKCLTEIKMFNKYNYDSDTMYECFLQMPFGSTLFKTKNKIFAVPFNVFGFSFIELWIKGKGEVISLEISKRW